MVRTRLQAQSEGAVQCVGGFRVIRKAVLVLGQQVRKLRNIVTCGGMPIFNPDRRRLQADLDMDSPIVASLLGLLQSQRLLAGRQATTPVVLMSLAGCKRQMFHCDYDPRIVERTRVKPLGVLLSCEDGGSFTHSGGNVALDAGDVVVFDGDFVHAGSAYDNDHIRVHVYLDALGVKRIHNQTFYEKQDAIVEGNEGTEANRDRPERA